MSLTIIARKLFPDAMVKDNDAENEVICWGMISKAWILLDSILLIISWMFNLIIAGNPVDPEGFRHNSNNTTISIQRKARDLRLMTQGEMGKCCGVDHSGSNGREMELNFLLK